MAMTILSFNARVMTSTGRYKPATTFKANDYIINHVGDIKRITSTQIVSVDLPQMTNDNISVRSSMYHSALVIPSAIKENYDIWCSEKGWMKLPPSMCHTEISFEVPNQTMKTITFDTGKIEYTYELGVITGAFLVSGTLDKNTDHVYLSSDANENAMALINSLKVVTKERNNVPIHVTYTNNVCRIVVQDKMIAEVLHNFDQHSITDLNAYTAVHTSQSFRDGIYKGITSSSIYKLSVDTLDLAYWCHNNRESKVRSHITVTPEVSFKSSQIDQVMLYTDTPTSLICNGIPIMCNM